MNKIKILPMASICALLFAATGAFAFPENISVSIPPQKYFVQRISLSHITPMVLLPPGADPHTYEPKPRQMEALQGGVLFAAGVPFERELLGRIQKSSKSLRIADTLSGIKFISDAHGADPHTWVSPMRARKMAQNIRDTLTEIDPANRQTYAKGYVLLVADIDMLDRDIKKALAPHEGKAILVYHPAWEYFCADYGIKQMSAEEEGKEPKPGSFGNLVKSAQEHGIKTVFVQPQASEKNASALARAINGRTETADPLAENWLGNMRDVTEKFRAALAEVKK